MNIDTMTLDQIRDYIAECKGYTKHISHWHAPDDDGFSHVPLPHPVPDTLDAAAGALPDGWIFYRVTNGVRGRLPGCAWTRRNSTNTVFVGMGTTEKEARFRAAAKAWQHERMAAKDHITLNLSNATPDELEAIKNAPDGMLIPVSGAIVDDYFKRPTNDDFTAYLVQQTWTLPTDTYPESKVYGTWGDYVRMFLEDAGALAPAGGGSVTDARPSWRPTDVPKAQEVKEPVWRISKADRSAVLHYLRMAQVLGYADDRLFGVHTRLLFGDPEAP